MSQEVVKYTKDQLTGVEKRMRSLGLKPEDVMREMSFALQIVNNSDQLLKCSPESIQSAIVNIANIGLTLNPASKEAYLIARWNGKKKVMEATLEPSYIGLSKLSMETGSVNAIITHVVYKNDYFDIDLANDTKPVVHKPILVKAEKGPIIGAYSVATLTNGRKQVEWMDIDEIYTIRARSESYKAFLDQKITTCTWVTDEGEMFRKTLIKRLVKYLPRTDKSDKLDEAIQLDNRDFGATFQQSEFISDLLQKCNISPEKSAAIWDRLNNGMGYYEANDVIEFLKSNQVALSPADKLNAKQLDNIVRDAVEKVNT